MSVTWIDSCSGATGPHQYQLAWGGNQLALPNKIDVVNLCAHCMNDVFNHNLCHYLLSAKTKASVELVYAQPSSDLYASTLLGCRWCLTIAHAVRHVADDVNFRNSEDEDADQDYGYFPMTHLCCKAVIKTTVCFCKHNDQTVFNAVEVQIEVTKPNNEACSLPEIIGNDSISLKFELSSNESQHFQKNWGRISADSDEWLAPALNWLRLCESHNHCKTDGIFCPSRLIDVTDLHRPRLINRGEIQTGDGYFYATLSYVWGPAQLYVLKTANERHLRLGLDPVLLPKTVEDAIQVTSRLGIKYIWVDALCIIQDSPNDKALEVLQMAKIYRNSALTIFAASASCAGNGFLKPLEGLHQNFTPIEIHLSTGDSQQFSILLGETIDPNPYENAIYSRAWPFQEQLLSPRLLFFEHGGVFWECLESCITYRGPVTQTQIPFLSLCRAGNKLSGDSAWTLWNTIRFTYCRKSLTFLGDKLDALSALASEISRATGWTYLAGLWKEHLVEELLWYSVDYENDRKYPILKSARARAAERVAPSWSWASVAEGDIFPTDHIDGQQPFEFEVLDCRLEAAGANPFGTVKSGFLEVQGKIADLRFRPEFQPEMMNVANISLLDKTHTRPLEPDHVIGYGLIDPLDVPLPSNILRCLAVAKQLIFSYEVIEGLMLLPAGNDAFRRIGFFRVHLHDVFYRAPRQVAALCDRETDRMGCFMQEIISNILQRMKSASHSTISAPV